MTYDFWYWPTIPGRGEFVRLTMEACGISYRDCAREKGAEALMADLEKHDRGPVFAPPYIVFDGIAISQVANILFFLSDRHDCAAGGAEGATLHWVRQVELTVQDVVAEAHNVHHPVGGNLYYEDQKSAASQAAEQFREYRIPKFFAWFERCLSAHSGSWLTGRRWSHADLSLFQLISGLYYAFPKRMAAVMPQYPKLHRLHEDVSGLPVLQDYFASDRRIPFNEDGIFRHYPELDAA